MKIGTDASEFFYVKTLAIHLQMFALLEMRRIMQQ